MHLRSELFTPYQPSINHFQQNDVRYDEAKPGKNLSDYVHCYWSLQSTRPLDESFLYRVVSDGCVDILFEQSSYGQIFITGFSAKFLEYDLGKSFSYFGIRFLPTGFPTIFEIAADKLTNSFLTLAEVVPSLHSEIEAAQKNVTNLETAVMAFDGILTNYINESEPPVADDRFISAFNQILESRGDIKLSELDIALSERQLRRLFNFYFGESPKTFAKILRFQNILGAKPSAESLKHNKIFYKEGYYDQAHFIKEFKEFYGVTPGQAFGY